MSEPTSPTRTSDRLSWPLGSRVIVWIAVAVAGWYGISAYGFKGDPQATTGIVPQWPAESTIARLTERPTLVLFLHPKCPCSRATVGELERLPVLAPSDALPDDLHRRGGSALDRRPVVVIALPGARRTAS